MGPVNNGSIAITTTTAAAIVTAGSSAISLPSAFTVQNGGPGAWGGASFAISYSGATGWLTLSTSLDAAGVITGSYTVDPTSLSAGTETATITVTDARSTNSPQTTTLTLTVQANSPRIGLSSSTLVLSAQAGSAGAPQTVTISNAGGGSLTTPTVGTITGTASTYVGTPTITGTGPWTLTVTPNAAGASAGTYQAVIPILSTGAANTPQNVTATLTVTAAQQALLSGSLNISDAAWSTGQATPTTEVVSLFSSNATPLAGPTIQSTTVTGVNGSGCFTTAIAGSTLTIAYNTASMSSTGTTLCRVVVQDAAASNTFTHYCYLVVNNVGPVNVAHVNSTAVSVPVLAGTNATPQTLTLNNNGSGGMAGLGTVSVAMGSPVSWCTPSYTGGTSTGTITLTFTTASLSAGTYTNSLVVTCSGASNSPVTIPLQVVVSAASAVRLARYTLPVGVTQDSGTGAFSGVPTGVSATRPSNWNSAATATVSGTGSAGLADLQSKINAAASSNNPVIDIPAGVTLTGTLNLPPRTGTGYCVIRTNGYASLPAQGTRLNPTTHGAYLATISTPNADPAIRTIQGANNYFFLGVQATTSATSTTGTACNALVTLSPLVQGTWTASHVAGQTNAPQNIYFHQCYIHGLPGTRKCIGSTSTFNVGVEDSYLDGARVNGFECQAINITYGGGSWYIKNNHLSGCGEHFMIGGGAIPIQADEWNTRDVYITGNYFAGLREWFAWSPGATNGNAADGMGLGFKNLFELKRGRRVLIVGNVFKTGGIAGQAGIQIVFKSDNNGNPGPTVSGTFDVHFLKNVVYDVQRCFNVIGNSSPAGGTTIPNDRHHISDNIFYLVNVPPNNGSGYLAEVGNRSSNIDITHNTIVMNGGNTLYGMLTVSNGTVYNLTYTDNIAPKGTYGLNGSQGTFGLKTLNSSQVSGWTWTRNVHPGTWTTGEKNNFPGAAQNSSNQYPASESAVGFTTYPGTGVSSFALAASSPYVALDTTTSPASPAGADVAAVAAAVAGVED